MLVRSISSYGAPYVDAGVVENPQTDLAAEYGNLLMEDSAQMTNTALRAFCSFVPTAGVPVILSHWSLWGSGDAQKPTIVRGVTGVYVVTYPVTMVDGLGESETVAFRAGYAHVITELNYSARLSGRTANTATVRLWNAAAPAVLSDLSASEVVQIFLY